MKIVNATPHPIVVRTKNGTVTYPVSGLLPRVSTVVTPAGHLNNIPCVSQILGDVEGLPESATGTVYIVSAMVLNASNRADLVAPDTGKTCIRDESGHIQAITQFIRRAHDTVSNPMDL